MNLIPENICTECLNKFVYLMRFNDQFEDNLELIIQYFENNLHYLYRLNVLLCVASVLNKHETCVYILNDNGYFEQFGPRTFSEVSYTDFDEDGNQVTRHDYLCGIVCRINYFHQPIFELVMSKYLLHYKLHGIHNGGYGFIGEVGMYFPWIEMCHPSAQFIWNILLNEALKYDLPLGITTLEDKCQVALNFCSGAKFKKIWKYCKYVMDETRIDYLLLNNKNFYEEYIQIHG